MPLEVDYGKVTEQKTQSVSEAVERRVVEVTAEADSILAGILEQAGTSHVVYRIDYQDLVALHEHASPPLKERIRIMGGKSDVSVDFISITAATHDSDVHAVGIGNNIPGNGLGLTTGIKGDRIVSVDSTGVVEESHRKLDGFDRDFNPLWRAQDYLALALTAQAASQGGQVLSYDALLSHSASGTPIPVV